MRRGLLPAKYLAPGVLFLAVFQIFVVGYSGYIAFTNYGDGHNSIQQDAIDAIIQTAQKRVPDSPAYRVTILEQLGGYAFLVTDPDDDVLVGDEGSPLERVGNAELDGTGKAIALDGYTALGLGDLLGAQRDIADLIYDEQVDTFTTPDGTVYRDA